VAGDGNCFFRSVAHHVFGNDALHMRVRDEVVRFAVANWFHPSLSLHTFFDDSDAVSGPEDYARWMGQATEYGGETEVAVVRQLYNRPILIW
ncbi:unnamed protein product, partial [Phaeothamnion confervicola]